MMTLYPKQLPISEHYVREKKDSDTKIQHSIESFQISWLKEVTSPEEMEQAENRSMDRNFQTKTLKSNTISLSFFQWPMLDQTPMAPSSSSPSYHAHGLTENTLSSEKSLKERTSLTPFIESEAKVELQPNNAKLLTVD